MSYIYKITNIINGKIYIGKTNRTIEERFKEHCQSIYREEKRPLYSAMKKYGIENFIIEEIEECPINIVDEREKYWIEYFNSFKYGYNATIGGDGKAYIDRELVAKTYQQVQNCAKTAKICNVCIDSVYQILREYNIQIKASQQVSKDQYGKKIIMLDKNNNIIKVFSSVSEAALYLKNCQKANGGLRGVASHIRDVCNQKRKTAYSYKWEWLI